MGTEAVRYRSAGSRAHNARDSDIIAEPINLIPHKKFSVGSRHNAVQYRAVDPSWLVAGLFI